MIFVEFKIRGGGRYFFVGLTVGDVLNRTDGGKSFQGYEFTGHKKVEEHAVLEAGIRPESINNAVAVLGEKNAAYIGICLP